MIPYKILSFGAGLQSTTLQEKCLRGEFERPDAIIIADTGWEHPETVKHIQVCEEKAKKAGIPFYIVSNGNIKEDLKNSAARANLGDVDEDTGEERRSASLPLYTRDPETGDIGTLRRQCTKEYKIIPVNRKARELIGVAKFGKAPTGAIEIWMGITTDEMRRVTVSRERWRINRYPLIEMRMTRHDCTRYLESLGEAVPPRSACPYCPFQNNAEWRRVKDNPELWKEVTGVDEMIRRRGGMRGDLFLHNKAIPLTMVDLSTPKENGQEEIDLFQTECSGGCGL